jgi:hypothetical protein
MFFVKMAAAKKGQTKFLRRKKERKENDEKIIRKREEEPREGRERKTTRKREGFVDNPRAIWQLGAGGCVCCGRHEVPCG